MKWKTPPVRQKIESGTERYCMKFAWLPVQASDGYTHWLEKVYVRERYYDGYVSDLHYWYVAEWIGNKAPEGEVDS